MAINPDRPIITYENVALFQSQTPAHSAVSNSGSNLSFLPLVQGIDFSVDIQRTNAGALGTKGFVDQSNRNAPDVNFTINIFEDFGNLFSGLFFSDNVRDNLNIDRNFYAIVGDERGVDVSGENLNGRDVLSFGNCFLNNVSLSQSVNGLMNSSYSYVGSNLQAQELQNIGNLFSGDAPSINLTGDQSQEFKVLFSGMDNYYSNSSDDIIPHYSTSVTISGNGSVGNFLIKSDSIQSFDLNLPINRKTIYSLGKKYPIKRKALFPSEGTFSFSNRVSNFEVNGDRANLKDFLNSDESYTLTISGQDNGENDFNFQISDAKLISQNHNSAIGSDIVADLGFSFELNKFSKAIASITNIYMRRQGDYDTDYPPSKFNGVEFDTSYVLVESTSSTSINVTLTNVNLGDNDMHPNSNNPSIDSGIGSISSIVQGTDDCTFTLSQLQGGNIYITATTRVT